MSVKIPKNGEILELRIGGITLISEVVVIQSDDSPTNRSRVILESPLILYYIKHIGSPTEYMKFKPFLKCTENAWCGINTSMILYCESVSQKMANIYREHAKILYPQNTTEN